MQRWYRSVKATGNKGHHIHTISAMAFGATGLVFRKKKKIKMSPSDNRCTQGNHNIPTFYR